MGQYLADYHAKEKGLYSETFDSLTDIEEYNKQNNIRNHNIHKECLLEDLFGSGLIVCIEGIMILKIERYLHI